MIRPGRQFPTDNDETFQAFSLNLYVSVNISKSQFGVCSDKNDDKLQQVFEYDTNSKNSEAIYRVVAPGGYFHIGRSGGGGGLTPKFASEILVGAPNFASRNISDKYPNLVL